MSAISKRYPHVVVVNENDEEIGEAPLSEVWRLGLYHRIVSVFIFDDHSRMLLQLRSPRVKAYPNRWDQAAGGHVDAGHDYVQTALDELAEETGITDVQLTTIDTFQTNTRSHERTINQFERVFSARVASKTTLTPNEEVSELRWFEPSELKALISEHPESCTAGLVYILRQYFHY